MQEKHSLHSGLAHLGAYQRLQTIEVKIGDLLLGNGHPIRVQTMTTTDTMDTDKTVEQVIKCIQAGAELVRITAPSKKEADNLANIKSKESIQLWNELIANFRFAKNSKLYSYSLTGALAYVAFVPETPMDQYTVMPMQIFNWISRPQHGFQVNAAAGIIILLCITFLLNGIAVFLRNRWQKKVKW